MFNTNTALQISQKEKSQSISNKSQADYSHYFFCYGYGEAVCTFSIRRPLRTVVRPSVMDSASSMLHCRVRGKGIRIGKRNKYVLYICYSCWSISSSYMFFCQFASSLDSLADVINPYHWKMIHFCSVLALQVHGC